MSWDIYVRRPECEHCKREYDSCDSFNMTCNIGGILAKALTFATGKEMHFRQLHGFSASDAMPILMKAQAYLKDPANEAELKALEPENKWGSLESATKTFSWMMRKMSEEPASIVEIY